MPQALTTQQITQSINAIKNGGTAQEKVQQAIGVYDTLLAQGYNYAGWAGGVARGDTVTGVAALDYLQGTALMGLGGEACRNLTSQQIDKIKVDMALGYLNTLKVKADTSGGSVSQDVSFKETRDFHEQAMLANHLDISTWTLNTPMDLIQKKYGDQAVEENWQLLRDTGGTGLDAIVLSVGLTYATGQFSNSSDTNISSPAQAWIDNTVGALNWEKIKRFSEVVIGDVAIDNLFDIYGAAIGRSLFLTMPGMSVLVNSLTTSALNWVRPKDPLVLDLDGGGISTSAITPNAPILFDQDGDGTKTATGWIASGEAIVVRDLNGNGKIDSGRELFGDSTVLTQGSKAGQLAANGFEALADLDADASGVADGQFDASDLAFSSVKLWQDSNQDGISQSGELHTFAELGVSSIKVTGSASNINLGGGNTQPFSGSFTRVDGQSGDSGTAQLAGSLLLANNNFYREFTDDPALTAEALSLPQMTGSGVVRDLRPALSLGNAQALDLQAKVTQFAADTTRAQQRADLDAPWFKAGVPPAPCPPASRPTAPWPTRRPAPDRSRPSSSLRKTT